MATSLRRSRRATPKQKNSDFNVGDIVEIEKHGIIYKGRLAQNLTEGPSPLPRWLVKFDKQNRKDEEMYERAFGKRLHSADEEVSAVSDTSPPPSRAVSPASSSSSQRSRSTKNETQKTTTRDKFDNDEDAGGELVEEDEISVAASGESSSEKSKRASAREARSRRRQQMIDEKKALEAANGKKKKRPLEVSEAEEKDVVKVKLLTGTLFMYKGLHRRVEFVRRV